MKLFGYIVFIGLLYFLLWFFVLRKFKFPKLSAITLFTGGVKVGKSAVSLRFAIKQYKRVHRRWRFSCFIAKLLRREKPEEPLFYSTIPLRGIPYVLVTKDHLMRKVRFNFKSVVFFDEASLLADSMLGMTKDKKIGSDLLLFFKLFGHETHGGTCIINSHCITDLHYAIRRCTSTYFYIHHLTSLPFIRIPYIREERFSEDGTTVNNYGEDVEQTLKRVIMSSRIFKKYDSYCYSIFTDSLPSPVEIQLRGRRDSLKADEIISFRSEFSDLSVSSDDISDDIIFNSEVL